jgi:hypothetical protein
MGNFKAMNPTTPTPTPPPAGGTKPNVTLKWTRESGDGKSAFVEAVQNDGWQDLRIEVDTDDCDSDHAKAAMQVVIDRCNGWTALAESERRLVHAMEKIVRQLGYCQAGTDVPSDVADCIKSSLTTATAALSARTP